MDTGDSDSELLFTGDDVMKMRGGPRQQAAEAQQDLSGYEDLLAFLSQQKPDPDGGTFDDFKFAAAASDSKADAAIAAQVAARDLARVFADHQRAQGRVHALPDKHILDILKMREFYRYDRQSPAIKRVIDDYIKGHLTGNGRSLLPPFGIQYYDSDLFPRQDFYDTHQGGYKSKSKSKKYRYNKKSKKSKTNKRRRSRSKSLSKSRKRN
jgi:hypothetical protein